MKLLLPFITGLLFLVGIYISRIIKNKGRLSNYAVSLALIVLFGLIFGDLIVELKEIYGGINFKVLLIVVLGIVILKLLDKMVPDHHHHHSDNEKNKKEHQSHLYHIGLVTLVSLLIHNIVEGMAIYLMGINDLKSGVIMALGVGLHNIPLGIEIGATMQDDIKKKRNMGYLTLLSLSSLIGGLIVVLFGEIEEFYLGYIIALTLGMCLYITVFELLPETITNIHKKETLLGIISGLLIVILMLII